ncbi:MAG: hypothetical protein IPK82_06030 [Polyangiaceae bacterium]|nr:hypothetical protein [Polyangiaceae bacterium]
MALLASVEIAIEVATATGELRLFRSAIAWTRLAISCSETGEEIVDTEEFWAGGA